MFSGISHARNFSRHNNHGRVEAILDKKIINIGQGNNKCGVNEQFFYFKYFHKKKNSIDKLVIFASAPYFFSETLPLASTTFEYEPFSVSFFTEYALFNSKNKGERLMNYVQTKLQPYWFNYSPTSLKSKDDALIEVDKVAVQEGFKATFGDGLASDAFEESKKVLENQLIFCKDKVIEVYVVITPTLFGKWPGHQELEDVINELKTKYHIKYSDFSEIMQEPKYYYDHHHLNTEGVVFFTENYLKTVLND